MTIPHFKMQQFIDYLKQHGCDVVSDENWNEYNRIILKKDAITFPLQCSEVVYFPIVCKICEDLEIEAPEEFVKVRDQIRQKNS